MLTDQKLIAFISTVNPDTSKFFYEKILGLKLLSQNNFFMEFDVHGTILRIQTVETLIPHPFTALGWNVDDIVSEVNSLNEKGVLFEKYLFLQQDELEIWTSPDGTKVAWFKDPEGNLLSLSEE